MSGTLKTIRPDDVRMRSASYPQDSIASFTVFAVASSPESVTVRASVSHSAPSMPRFLSAFWISATSTGQSMSGTLKTIRPDGSRSSSAR